MTGRVALVPASAFGEALGWYVPSAELVSEVEIGARVKVRGVLLEADGGADLESARPLWIELTACSSKGFEGAIATSPFDADGYRPGDRIEFTSDRVCDVVLVGEAGRPWLNEERARSALGKRVIVGLTTPAPGGEAEYRQLIGTLTAFDARAGLTLTLANGEKYNLPPDLTAFDEALPGEYRLRSTGEVVVDPDYISTWVIDREPPR